MTAEKPGIGIIGFGRVGRLLFRELSLQSGLSVAAIAEADRCGRSHGSQVANLAYLLAMDSTWGPYPGRVEAKAGSLIVNGETIPVDFSGDAGLVPWRELGVDILVEASGNQKSVERAAKLAGGRVKKVVITRCAACAQNTLVRGINLSTYDPTSQHVISCSTCTANALAPVLKVLDQSFGVDRGSITTVHPGLSGDSLLDQPHPEFAAGRSGLGVRAVSSQVANTTAKLLPKFKGRLMGMSLRVPTLTVNALIADLVLENPPQGKEQVVEALQNAVDGPLNGVLTLDNGFLGRPKASVDFKADPHSAIVDLNWLELSGGLLRLAVWHDNEYAYCRRVVETLELIAARL
jgi:glyceraldehyde 3-phosphate dehydrogenase